MANHCENPGCGCGTYRPHPNYEEDAPGYSIRTNMDYEPGGRPAPDRSWVTTEQIRESIVPGSAHVTAPATSPVFGAAMSYPQIGDGPLEVAMDPDSPIQFSFGEHDAGVTVGYFRHPDFPGGMRHTCGFLLHDHGWIDEPVNLTICPSDMGPFGGQTVTEAGRAVLGYPGVAAAWGS